jgi:hypothetical protein
MLTEKCSCGKQLCGGDDPCHEECIYCDGPIKEPLKYNLYPDNKKELPCCEDCLPQYYMENQRELAKKVSTLLKDENDCKKIELIKLIIETLSCEMKILHT